MEPAKILIVDDQIHALKGMSRIMTSAGYDTFEANNGEDCLKLAAEHKPDLILLDVVLPDIDGKEVCRRIKSNTETKNIYVVLVSSIKTESDSHAMGLEQGADGYIARPIANRELLARVKAILRLKHKEKILSETEERYRLLFQNMLEGCAYCKMLFDEKRHPDDWVYLDVNLAFEQLTGLENIVGKKVTEAIPGIKQAHPELFEICGRVALTGESEKFEIDFKPLGIALNISVFSANKGHFFAVLENITERKTLEGERTTSLSSLRNALAEVKKLSGFLPICASCKKIRDDTGYWNDIESYISEHSETQFSHGICPDCMRKLYPEEADEVLGRLEKNEQ